MGASISLFPTPGERYTVLLDLARTLGSTLAPRDLYGAIHTHVSRVLPTTRFAIALAEPGGRLRLVFDTGRGGAEVEIGGTELSRLRAGDFVLRAEADGEEVVVAAPLQATGHMLGCLVGRRPASRPFDVADAHFMLAVGGLAGVALDNVRLLEDAQRRREEAELLETVARDLGGSLELEEVAQRVATWARELTGEPVVVWVVDQGVARIFSEVGGAEVDVGEERSLMPHELARLAAAVPPGEAGEVIPGPFLSFGETGQLVVPLAAVGRPVAVLVVGREGRTLPDAQRSRLLARLATHAVSAIENSLLHAEVRRLSLTDPLVQLPNRRQLELFLEKEFAAAARGRPLCFVLFDLDQFKAFNDTHGHQAGDVALLRFAEVLRTETRAMNLAARYGGEEFAAVLSETAKGGGYAYAQRVRRRLQEALAGALTVSAGVACYREGMRSPEDMIAEADRALYRAKQAGRNRVIIAEPC